MPKRRTLDPNAKARILFIRFPARSSLRTRGRRSTNEGQSHRDVTPGARPGVSTVRILKASEAKLLGGRECRQDAADGPVGWTGPRVAALKASPLEPWRPVARADLAGRAIVRPATGVRPEAAPAGVGRAVATLVARAVDGTHALVAEVNAIASDSKRVADLSGTVPGVATRQAGPVEAGVGRALRILPAEPAVALPAAESRGTVAGLEALEAPDDPWLGLSLRDAKRLARQVPETIQAQGISGAETEAAVRSEQKRRSRTAR